MRFDTYIRKGHPILFGIIIFFSIIEGAIATWLTARFNEHHNYLSVSVRDRSRFLTFTSWWTVFFCALYLILFLHSAGGSVLTSVGSHGIFLTVTWIFWLAGAASITSALDGGYDCSNIDFNLPYCNQLNAEMGFAWVVWVFVTFALAVVIVRGCISRRHGDGFRGPLVDTV